MAYSDSFPATRPVFQADFANGGRVDPRISYSRSTTGTYFGTDKHLSSENLFTHSASSYLWATYNGASKADGAANGPDGSTNTAYSITFNNTSQYVNTGSVGLDTSASYTFSFYAKVASGTQTIIIGNIATGVFSNVTVTTDWQRFTVTQTPTATTRYPYIGPDGATGLGTLLIWGAQLEKRGSATALNETSGQIHREYAPTLQTAAINAPRFEFSASDSASMGLLIEGQVTNLQRYGSDFSSWSNKTFLGVESNQSIAPNGNLEADLLIADASYNPHYIYDNTVSVTAGTAHTFSMYLKDAGQRYVQICGLSSLQTSGAVNFDLQTGTASASGAHTGTITAVGNGWYRATVTTTSLFTATTGFLILAVDSISSGRGANSTGDGYKGFLAWGAQQEASSFASSLVDTGTGSNALTRAADSASIAVSDITGFSEGVGTIVCETGGVASATATNQIAFGLNGPASNNQFSAGVNDGGAIPPSTVRVYSQTPAGDQAFLNAGTATVGTGYKLACRYELDNIAASMNGGTVVSDTSGQVPVGIDTLWIGQLDGNYHINSNIKRIAIYSDALSDSNLISLTK